MQIASVPMSELEWNNAREQQHAVGDIIWPLANELFRIYAQVREPVFIIFHGLLLTSRPLSANFILSQLSYKSPYTTLFLRRMSDLLHAETASVLQTFVRAIIGEGS